MSLQPTASAVQKSNLLSFPAHKKQPQGICSQCGEFSLIEQTYQLPISKKVTSQFCRPCHNYLLDDSIA
jgi:hypothetical protein